MTTHNDDAAADLLIKEVDEDLRHERLETLWKTYGNLIIGASVALVVGVAGFQGWKAWDARERQHSSAQFSEATRLIEQGKRDQATTLLAKLVAEGTSGYRVLSELKLADLKQEAGDLASAAALYERIVAGGADTTYRDVARLKAAYLKLDTADPAAVEKLVEPLIVESSAWRHSAREITALAAAKRGDQAKAADLYRKIADDSAAPQGLRTRAAEMLAAIGGKPKG